MVEEKDLKEFFSYYLHLSKRHFFEHIFVDRPVRLYLDLEYYKEFNKNFDDQDFYDKFYPLFAKVFGNYYKANVSPFDFLILDSSNYEKYSKHLILKTPGYLNRILR